ncbi:MAG TPA: 4Fe-4S dicluster domain-containing protein [Stellaceae bacterium]|nr:4Fe-4S dicluster domain-containing protein [Stellaceae bacterium]
MSAVAHSILTGDGLEALLGVLRRCGYRVLGPTVRDQAIVYDDIATLADLPRGWTDEQQGGHYRLRRRDDDALFGYAVGPHSWKQFLHAPRQRLWHADRTADGFGIATEPASAERLAFVGVRACELHAIAIQDRVLVGGAHVDPHYRARREAAFLVAVNCGAPGGTCFCVSMNTGPKTAAGYDLALTELIGEPGGRFVVEAGSAAGRTVLAELPHREATPEEVAASDAVVARAAAQMGRAMPAAADVPDLLRRNLDHPRWDEVAGRCLTCGNCTMVCPTCFCTTVEDTVSLDGTAAERVQRWDSCFTMDFSYLHGGSVRASPRSRYRQWMTHKLSSWVDQFGSSGCVGCGRCITWCPVGIDITEEVAAIRATDAAAADPGG